MKSGFNPEFPCDVRKLDVRDWLTLEKQEFWSEKLQQWCVIPRFYTTDGASVPSGLSFLYPREGRGFRAAILHDTVYDFGYVVDQEGRHRDLSQHEADDLFLEALASLGMNTVERHMAWLAVRVGGRSVWKKHRERA